MSRSNALSRLWRTAAVRLAAVFALIFGSGTVALLGLLDIGIGHFAENEVRDALRHQMAIIRADAQLEGGAALVNILNEHIRTDTVGRYRYLVIPPDGQVFNSGVPEEAVQITGFGHVEAVTTDLTATGRKSRAGMLILTERISDGTFMAVGRESYPLDALRTTLNRIALWGSLSLILLALLASFAAGLLFIRRLERVNATTRRIIDGNLSERLPSIGFGQEFNDLTDNLNTMLDRLEAAMTGLRQMSTDIAHDLRQPLTRLRHRLEELNASLPDQAGPIESALEEADELLSMFNAMLRLARLEAGSLPGDIMRVDLTQIAVRAVEAYRPAAEDAGRLLWLDAEGPHEVRADPALMSQLLANLIDNGLRHTPEGSRITVRLARTEREIRLTVSDDGPGVPEDALPRLTQRLFRVDHSRTSPGTGLGLTLVAAIAEHCHARLMITNTHPGLRVDVTFSL